jgi:periplasmic copper chaperone A
MRYLALFLLCAALPAWGQVEIDKPWSRATPPGAKVAAGYMVLRNRSAAADRLIAVSSPAAARVEMHVHLREGEVVRMREVKGYDIPPGGSFELRPGGAHLMFIDIKQPFKEGEQVALVLRFERAGEIRAHLRVARLGAAAAGHSHR